MRVLGNMRCYIFSEGVCRRGGIRKSHTWIGVNVLSLCWEEKSRILAMGVSLGGEGEERRKILFRDGGVFDTFRGREKKRGRKEGENIKRPDS